MKEASHKYKAVIFDFDDTLVISREVKWAHHQETARRFYNLEITDEMLHKHWGKPFHAMVGDLYGPIDTPENIISSIRSIGHEFPKEPHDKAADLLTSLLDHDLVVGIVSAAPTDMVTEDLLRLGFPVERLAFIQGSEKTNFHKPDPRVFSPMIEILASKGIDKKEIVYIGDSIDDWFAARDARIHFVGITTGLYSREVFETHDAPCIIEKISELPRVILN